MLQRQRQWTARPLTMDEQELTPFALTTMSLRLKPNRFALTAPCELFVLCWARAMLQGRPAVVALLTSHETVDSERQTVLVFDQHVALRLFFLLVRLVQWPAQVCQTRTKVETDKGPNEELFIVCVYLRRLVHQPTMSDATTRASITTNKLPIHTEACSRV